MMENNDREVRDDIVIGRNAVLEALMSEREADCLWIVKGNTGATISKIIGICRDKNVTIKDVSPIKLDNMCAHANHQGVILTVAANKYYTVEEIMQSAKESGKPPFLLILDEIEDPHNLGAIIRSAEATGVSGIIIPKRRSVGLSYTVAKVASGATEHVKVARVSNLVATMEDLKKQGLWFYAADMTGEHYNKVKFDGAVALVIGAEGTGISRLIKEHCDVVVSIPMVGKINSLNASVAASVLMFKIAEFR